jgi:hypothetical protein
MENRKWEEEEQEELNAEAPRALRRRGEEKISPQS